MGDQRITEALTTASDTQDVVLGDGALDSVAEVFQRNFGEVAAVVVADDITWDVAGPQVEASLRDAGTVMVDPYVYPGEPELYASHDNVVPLVTSLQGHDAVPVAVGSGTLNDLVKRGAHEVGRPYMVVGTAASMDGYTSFGASLTVDGAKQTLECPAPRAVVGDLRVMRDAPADLTASGYGDLLGKVPAGADWIVADTFGVDPIHEQAWELVQGPLHDAVGRPAELAAGDLSAMEALIDGLVMSGLAMQAASSSRPASGAEHYFSHLWEMEDLAKHHPSHGFKVGLGTISIAAFYERFLERDLSAIDIDARATAWPSRDDVEQQVRAAHDQLLDRALEQTLDKYITAEELRDRLDRLRRVWSDLRERLAAQLLPAEQLEQMLTAAGCPTTPSQIGLSMDDLRATYTRARMIRSRYTALDLALEAGVLEECIDELFAPGGYWADQHRQ